MTRVSQTDADRSAAGDAPAATGSAQRTARAQTVKRAVTRGPNAPSAKYWVYLAPAVAVFVLFLFFPLGQSVFLSFHGTNVFTREPTDFVGFDQYVQLFTDPSFRKVLVVTLGFVLMTVVPSIVIAVCLGLLLHQRVAGVRFFRSAYALPFAYSVATASVLFGAMYQPLTGIINSLLSYVGVGRIGWLTDPRWALISVSLATVWMQLGYNLMIVSAGLGTVDDEIVEAARIDGARGLRMQTNILLPLITPQIFFLVVTGTISALQSFGQIHILTQGQPLGATTTLVYSIYLTAGFGASSAVPNYGFASAQAIVLLLIVILMTIVQFGVLERRVFYR